MFEVECKKGYKIEAIKSAAGYYLGTRVDGMPNCRLTTTYAKTEKEAEKLCCDRQSAMENQFCNGCGCCFK